MPIRIQILIIMGISFLGEILHALIPLPVPAGIYGMLLLLIALCTKLIPLHAVKDAGDFLIELLPVTIVPSAVGLMENFGLLQRLFLPISVVTVISTILVMGISAWVTQAMIRLEKKGKQGKEGSA